MTEDEGPLLQYIPDSPGKGTSPSAEEGADEELPEEFEVAAGAGPQIPELSAEEWRDRALRLQADIENYRKRQQRLAREQVLADRERLLQALLDIADDLRRALQVSGSDGGNLWQGVQLTYQNVMNVLWREGVEPIEAQGETFDPLWHEAVGTVPHDEAGVDPNTVVEEMQRGYRIGNRLLRPARVVVAV
jgi:molecular chaperone GrpE